MRRKRLRLLALGGTISMQVDGRGLQPVLDAGQLAAATPVLAALAHIESTSLCRLPSAHLTLRDVLHLAREIARARADGCDGIVVTVGTDTLEEIAFALDVLTSGAAPVVVTGAMRASSEPGADGARNLQSAAIVSLAPQTRDAGVLVTFADEIHDPLYVQKLSSLRVAAFGSPGFGPLGYVIEGTPVVRPRSHAHRLPIADFDFRPGRVPILTCALGSTELLHALTEEALDGLVIAGFGDGHVPLEWIEPLTRLAARVPVVLASRVPEGPVLQHTYGFAGSEIDLLERGLIPAGFLHPLKSRLLLSLGIGVNRTRSELAACFATLQPDQLYGTC